MNYKEHAIKEILDFIQDIYADHVDRDNLNESLELLDKIIDNLYSIIGTGSDVQDACFRCAKKRIAEALDKPLEEIPTLLFEKTDVPRKLFYYNDKTKEY